MVVVKESERIDLIAEFWWKREKGWSFGSHCQVVRRVVRCYQCVCWMVLLLVVTGICVFEKNRPQF
jgi:hypothetical protein